MQMSLEQHSPRFLKRVVCLAVLGLAFIAQAQSQGIYTCVDATGRRLSADRPIAECSDRVQRQLSGTGAVKREIGPTLTDKEVVIADERARVARQAAEREAETRRRDRALLQRFPNAAVHEQERVAALTQIDEVIKATQKRSGELAEQRTGLNSEAEFYAPDPVKMPPTLKRRLDENDKSVAVQKTFVGEQDNEKKRINQRFDEERVKLKQLWSLRDGPAATSPAGLTATSRP